MVLYEVPALSRRRDHPVAGQISRLARDARRSAPDPAVDHQAEAEAHPEAQQDEVVDLGAASMDALGQRRQVHVVLQQQRHRYGTAERLAEPASRVGQPCRVRETAPVRTDHRGQSHDDLGDVVQRQTHLSGQVDTDTEDLLDEGVASSVTLLFGADPGAFPAGHVHHRGADLPVSDVHADREGAVGVHLVERGRGPLASGHRAHLDDHTLLRELCDRGGHRRPRQGDPPGQVSDRDRTVPADRLQDRTTVE